MFYTGVGGWADRQLPDGTVIWTALGGITYTTKPGGSLFFPTLATPTGWFIIASDQPPLLDKGVMMPRRKRTRAQNHAQRVAEERQINEQLRKRRAWLAESIKPPPTDNDPPPF